MNKIRIYEDMIEINVIKGYTLRRLRKEIHPDFALLLRDLKLYCNYLAEHLKVHVSMLYTVDLITAAHTVWRSVMEEQEIKFI